MKSMVVFFILICNLNMSVYAQNSVPESILRMTETYPETKPLIDYYNEILNDEDYYTRKIDISEELLTDDVPLFIQWDKRWAFRKYGKETLIATSACGPVCLSMLQCYFNKCDPKTPVDMANFSRDNGFYMENIGTSGALFSDGAYYFGLKAHSLPINENEIKKALDDDKIIIALVKEGHFTRGGHYIIIKNYNQNGDFLVNDPNSFINSKKSWTPEIILTESRKLWAVGVG